MQNIDSKAFRGQNIDSMWLSVGKKKAPEDTPGLLPSLNSIVAS